MAFDYELGFLGAGHMAEGIVAAVVGSRLYEPAQILVSDPSHERRALFADRFGVGVTEDNAHVVRQAGRVVWAVKPQIFDAVARELPTSPGSDHLLISIMAGVSTAKIEEAFSHAPMRVVRAMPNLPIRVGAGMTGLCKGAHATADDLAQAEAIFQAGGGTVVVKDEALMDAVTAISGSGPAYFYYFVEALTAGGVACGLDEADALALAEHTCLGAARMMLESGEPPAELRAKVTSKGGTTQAALERMARDGVDRALREAVRAAYERGRQLGA
jgi:pyrroline-5-carboxylate reductase